MADVDGLDMGLAQHDPLDMMMGALADMHEVSSLHARGAVRRCMEHDPTGRCDEMIILMR